MNDKTIGKCSLCGGAVTVPAVWFGVVPPTPTCQKCGAISDENPGPVIPMRPAPKVFTSTTIIVTPDPEVVTTTTIIVPAEPEPGSTGDVPRDFLHTETTGNARCKLCGCRGAHYCTGGLTTGTLDSVRYKK